MLKVELIYDFDCPNVSKIRKMLGKVFLELNLKHHWIEWNRSDQKSPHYVMKYSSPTILINDKDVDVLSSEISGMQPVIFILQSQQTNRLMRSFLQLSRRQQKMAFEYFILLRWVACLPFLK